MWKRILGFVLVLGAFVAVLLWSQRRTGPLQVSGFLEADQIRVGSRVGGRIRAVHVEEGQAVAQGQLLLELEPFDLEAQRAQAAAGLQQRTTELARLEAGFRPEEIAQAEARKDRLAAQLKAYVDGPRKQEIEAARADLSAAAAAVELARLEFARTKRLFESSTVSQDDLDKATASLRVAEEQHNARAQQLELLEEGTRAEVVAGARAQLAEAEAGYQLMRNGYRKEEVASARAAVAAAQATLDALDARLAELKVVAPVAGTIEAFDLREGDLVGPNAPVLSLLDPRRLWVRAYVPEDRLAIRPGRDVRVRVDAFPGESFAGKVSFVAREAEFLPGNVQTPEERAKQVYRIKVDLLEGLDRLRPGVPVDLVFD